MAVAGPLELELEIGRRIQATFLPEAIPQLPGWEIAVRFQPARQVAEITETEYRRDLRAKAQWLRQRSREWLLR